MVVTTVPQWITVVNTTVPTPLRMDGHSAPNCSVASSTHLCNTRKVTGRSELDNDVHEELCRQGDEHHQSVPVLRSSVAVHGPFWCELLGVLPGRTQQQGVKR